MRLRLVALTVVATLLSTGNADSTPTYGRKGVVALGAHRGDTTGARLLRGVENENEDDASDEDRLYLPGLETVSNYIWSLSGPKVTSKTIDGWLKKGESTDDAEPFNRRNPGNEATMSNIFRKAYGDEKLAKIQQTAKGVKETESLAKALQVQQFKQWIDERMNPKYVFSSVFKLSTD
ncbi:hypothetical protein PHYSODRAFT_333414 [Phytophthora sojae]|uniref:RxLR effector protein n=2 Tax=Phytophthora sojae TaxID=67593 RepID=G4ZPA4_PHYSP|nr:hypothetical protein PHYSODRAFT_333414 [Phytophthora sojae]AEK80997.1 Avh234 [Phytophthora sojae]EGZ15144.1 hypothetical protein PHYSODRAFT_333414 [Phytophthora sojae]|eukprot:XP_009528893.1 hypothetical protein PHYSODRAFT_333414 [Phytophthora sojae]